MRVAEYKIYEKKYEKTDSEGAFSPWYSSMTVANTKSAIKHCY